jgi:prepilin-type N-terminal cleavage/methylation domain-containing protein
MPLTLVNNKGFSMMEALVAAMIFSIGVVGVYATMSSQNEPSMESDERVKAAFAGKRFLETLRGKVDAQTYSTGDLSIGTHNPVSVGTYTFSYVVSNPGGSGARHVDLTITW